MQNWLLHWLSNQKVFASSLQTKQKKKNENERKQFPEQVTRTFAMAFQPFSQLPLQHEFPVRAEISGKSLSSHRRPTRQTNGSAPRQAAWRNPHTRSLDQGQGHAGASASTHWATCPLISSGLCLAFKLHRGCMPPPHGEETWVLTLSWNRGSHKENVVLSSENLGSAFDTSKLYNPGNVT